MDKKTGGFMNNQEENKMGVAPIGKLLISMSLPTIFSMLISSLYNVVDSIFVARISEKALTAVTLAMPLQLLIISVAVGTGVGVNSFISRKLGEKNFDEVNKAAVNGFMLGALNYVVFALFGIFFTKMFFQMFTTDSVVLQYAIDYTKIVLIFSFGIFLSISCEKTIQGTGNMKYPMLFQLIGAVINIILDPILIFGLLGFPAMGVAGAAIATVIGQIASMIFAIWVISTKNFGFHFSLKGFKPDLLIIKKIYEVGLPSIVMQSITSFLAIALNGILMQFSETAVSVMGIYNKLQSFIFMPVFGLNQGLMPLLGYNYGAKNKQRIKDTYKIGVLIATGIMLFGMIVFNLFAKELLLMFDASPHMLEVGIPALRIISLCFVFAGIGIINSTVFQAIGDGKLSLLISILRQAVIILPVSYFGAKFFGVSAVWFAFPISEIVAVTVSVFMLIKAYNQKIRFLD